MAYEQEKKSMSKCRYCISFYSSNDSAFVSEFATEFSFMVGNASHES